MMYCARIVAILLVIVGSAGAIDVTLPQALADAESHSYSLKATRAEATGAEQSLNAARAGRWPQLSASFMALYKSEIPVLDITLPLPAAFSIHREIGTKEVYQSDLQLAVPLYTGGRLGSSIGLARTMLDYREFLVRASREQVWFQTIAAYLAVIRARSLEDVAGASLQRAQVMQDNIAAMYDAGAADSTDILEVALAVVESSLQVRTSAAGRQARQIELAQILGWSPDQTPDPTDKLPAPVVPEVADQNQPGGANLLALRTAAEAAGRQTDLARADLLPAISAFAGYSLGHPNQEMFDDSWNDYFSVGARLSWSLNLGWRESKVVAARRAEARATQHRYTQANDVQQARLQMALIYWRAAFESFEATAEKLRIARANYRLAGKQHEQGDLSPNRLLEIEALLTQTEAGLATAIVDYHLARASYIFLCDPSKLTEGF